MTSVIIAMNFIKTKSFNVFIVGTATTIQDVEQEIEADSSGTFVREFNRVDSSFLTTYRNRITFLTHTGFSNSKLEDSIFVNSLIIIDEAHIFRNSNAKSSNNAIKRCSLASKVLLITATPLVNDITDLGSLLMMINPSFITRREGGILSFSRSKIQDKHSEGLLKGLISYVDKIVDTSSYPLKKIVSCNITLSKKIF